MRGHVRLGGPWAWFGSQLLPLSFSSLVEFYPVRTRILTFSKDVRDLSAGSWRSLSAELSPRWNSVLQLAAALASLNSNLFPQLSETAVLCWDSPLTPHPRQCASWQNTR